MIVEEVGEENFAPVIIDNATNYNPTGEMLMQTRKRLYWTLCADTAYVARRLREHDISAWRDNSKG